MNTLFISALLNNGLNPELQKIEVSSSLQIPSFHIVGLPGPEVEEARERVRAAIQSSGFEFPKRRVVLNLSPASIRKQGTGLDLAMALSILRSSQKSKNRDMTCTAWGELGLDGTLKPAGQMTRVLYASWQAGIQIIIIAKEDLKNAVRSRKLIEQSGLLEGPAPSLRAASNLAEAWNIYTKNLDLDFKYPEEPQYDDKAVPVISTSLDETPLLPLAPSLARVLGVAAAGSHHILLLGPRGTGKSHALEWLIALQPTPTASIRLAHALLSEITSPTASPCVSPVRRIGAQSRPAALIGTANSLTFRPGEFSLAHGGLLVADELPEWARDSRESLREPMERGVVTLTRTRGTFELPAQFVLAANGNFCPCGGWPSHLPMPTAENYTLKVTPCKCSSRNKEQYLARLSGPVLDRIDILHSFLQPPTAQQTDQQGFVTELRNKTIKAREESIRRWGKPAGQLTAQALEKLLHAHPEWNEFPALNKAVSLRSRHKVLRIALSLSAWDNTPQPNASHFSEAACYRPERFGICN